MIPVPVQWSPWQNHEALKASFVNGGRFNQHRL
jgi:hypothetical protein